MFFLDIESERQAAKHLEVSYRLYLSHCLKFSLLQTLSCDQNE